MSTSSVKQILLLRSGRNEMIYVEKTVEFRSKNTIGIFAYCKKIADSPSFGCLLFSGIIFKLIYSDLVGCKFFFNPQDLIVNSAH